MNFKQKIDKKIQINNSCVCVGLDSDYNKIPKFLKNNNSASQTIFNFNKQIIDQTIDLVCAYKPNVAFYEAKGIEGLKALKKTVSYIKKKDSEVVIIADAKRADIGNTNLGYVSSFFDHYNFDAITVHPYLGKEALKPFLQRKDRGIIILCKTSNTGAGEFQDLTVQDSKFGTLPLYKNVAHHIVNSWNKNKNCSLVVGATYPQELKEVRKIVEDMPILIPGIGAQGGDIEKTVKAGRDKNGRGMIINSSRGIIFASSDENFAEIAREKTEKLRKSINRYRK